jgi:hypothetical protein
LEPHHIRRLGDGGPDDPRFMGAVCPNCHREIHHGDNAAGFHLGKFSIAALSSLSPQEFFFQRIAVGDGRIADIQVL